MGQENNTEDTKQDDEDELFNDEEIESMMGEMFSIKYTVEVFGSIVDTNGQKKDDNTVEFSVGLDTNEVYYVEFKDMFIASWIGSILT